jgi:chromosome segregation ATPase
VRASAAVDVALQEARALGEERAAAAAAALAAMDAKLRGRLDALAADVARGEDVEAVATRVDASLDALGGRMTAAEEAVAAASDAMGASIAEVGAHLRLDLAAAAERLGLLEEAAVRAAESHPVGAAQLEAALEATEARLAHRAAAHEEAMAVLRRRLEEIAAADGVLADRLHGVETDLAARLEGVSAALAQQAAVAGDAAAAAALRLGEIEISLASLPDPAEVLRPELVDVRVRLELVEAAAAAAAQAGAGWSGAAEAIDARVTVVEAAQFSRDAVVEPRLAALEHRLEEEVSQADERARTVDRALRKGLASLGERLADSEAAYVEAGNALRTSIERLGSAVADADVRIATRAAADGTDRARFDADAYVAFVPTHEGYRLLAVDSAVPAVGDIVELDGHGCLRVSRLGASPIPLDTRACAYLEAPDDVPRSGDA